MMLKRAALICLLTTSAVAQPASQQQPAPLTEADLLGDVIAQQIKANARLIVQLNQMQQLQQQMQRMQTELVQEKARADAAEAQLSKMEPAK
jgi:hypothetical protein